MNPYKIMLVDDEEEVRTSIIRKIDWQDADFSDQGCGEQEGSWKRSGRMSPDVVLTDIRCHIWTGWRWRRIYGRDIRPSRSFFWF